MKTLSKILILILMIGCNLNVESEKSTNNNMSIEFEVIPEFGNNKYVINWADTLGSKFESEWNYLQIRPLELNCYITNINEDTLGFYQGLSSPRQFTYFQTNTSKDSIINIDFSVGINHFSEFLFEQTSEYINEFNKNNLKKIKFNRIRLNLKSDLRKRVDIELVEI